MHSLHLSGPGDDSPEAVVGWLGAVQAQDYGPAKWAVGQRVRGGITDAAFERAFNAGTILRTHVLRPTWHFVLPADIRWLLELTRVRVEMQSASMCRREGLDAATLGATNAVITAALRGGRHLTRKQLQVHLASAGIASPLGFRLIYMLMHAELNGLICSGAMAGKQQTYALLDERAPPAQARRLSHEEALAELTRRYFTSHGPATLKDFRWWSSLTVTDIRAGLAMAAGQLAHVDLDGTAYWFGLPPPATRPPAPTVHLIQGYDEYVVGYGDTKFALDTSGIARATSRDDVIFNMVVLLDSQAAGHWKRTFKKDGVHIDIALYAPFDAAQTEALYAACARHASFVGQPATVAVSVIAPGAGGAGGRSWWAPRGSGIKADRPAGAPGRRNHADEAALPVGES